MDGRNKLIQELRELVTRQAARIEKLTARIGDLELQLAKAKKDSTTSSKSPPDRNAFGLGHTFQDTPGCSSLLFPALETACRSSSNGV